MQRSRLIRAAAVTAATVVAGALVGAQPAHADITVDSAVCLNNASGTLSPSNAVIVPQPDFLEYARVNWTSTTDNQYCSQANAALLLKHNNLTAKLSPRWGGHVNLIDPGTYTLWVQTSLGSKYLASVSVTQG
jgi:hypothetical protein